MNFFFITSSPELARYAADHGVDRIFVDLEALGKHERQGHLDTIISGHSFEDLDAVRKAVPSTKLMARLNPVNPDTQIEIDRAINAGADILMLPMFRTRLEVEEFAGRTEARARVCILAETCGAVENLAECVAVDGVDEVHIGLNDLSLELGLPFMFQPLVSPLIDELAAILRQAGKPWGIGGVARVGEGLLPAELLLGEHVRLGSTGAILSRTFHRQATSIAEIESHMNFGSELARLRAAYSGFFPKDAERLARNHEEVVVRIDQIVDALSRAKG